MATINEPMVVTFHGHALGLAAASVLLGALLVRRIRVLTNDGWEAFPGGEAGKCSS